jgi:colanic acid biosynthesis glycosyl transferase WcaI
MKFLILTQYYPPEVGAGQVRLQSTVDQLLALGHDVEVVTALPNYPSGRIFDGYRGRFYGREDDGRLTIHRVWLHVALGAGLGRLVSYLSFAATSAVGLVRSERPDVIFVESPPLFLGLTGWLAARAWRRPWILNISDLWPDSIRALGVMDEGLALTMAEKLEHFIYLRADLITAVTDGIASELVNGKGVPQEQILFLPNGVDTELFRPRPADDNVRERFGFDHRRVVLYAGTMGFAHCTDAILDAAEILRERDVLFVLAGDGSDRERTEQRARERGLTNVLFLGVVPLQTVADLYSVALAGLATLRDLPLFEGARPAKVLPCLASGKPIVYSGRGEGARLITEADTGIVVEPEDGAAIAAAIERLLDEPGLAERLGGNGRRLAVERFGWRALVGDWLEQLARAAGSAPQRNDLTATALRALPKRASRLSAVFRNRRS